MHVVLGFFSPRLCWRRRYHSHTKLSTQQAYLFMATVDEMHGLPSFSRYLH